VYLFFDTETTGIPRNHNAPASDIENWPRLVQIAWALTDGSGNELRSQTFIIRPDGFDIPADATRIHGITTETARRVGIEIKHALTAFADDISTTKVLIAHNVQFDGGIVGSEFYRAGRKDDPLTGKSLCCTMRSSTNFCRLPGGPRGYKWPTLEQLYRILFSASFGSAHNAVADVRACAKCFFELKRRGIIAGIELPTDEDREKSSDDQELFDEIYEFAESCSWFDTAKFVDDVYDQFGKRGSISENQRGALIRIRDMLEEKSG
jgi:DNA polymerase III epsilon subunit-like protein